MVLAPGKKSYLKPTFSFEHVEVFSEGVESKDGCTYIDKNGKLVAILEDLAPQDFFNIFWGRLRDDGQSAVMGSFEDQKRMWSLPPNGTET